MDLDGRDIWEINSQGVISWIESNLEHRLYALNAEGVRTSHYVMVSDRSILDALSGETGLSSYTTGSNIDDIFKVFLFAADNSDVEWAVHRGRDNMYTIGTSHNEDSVDPYSVLSGKQISPISSVHSHPGTTDLTTMGYISETYYRSDQWKVNNGLAPKYNYVYFPCLKSLYQAGWYTPVYIRRVAKFQDFYFGTLNHK